ncbi:M48 family metalloprotease [Congregibacter variabilis]|uniref:M48 family metalloprotease n=1 Tax=Congregibacter variabilis TaxID=3081200 RepID=A0ABZ0I3R1_9GAMM|nr:M48 family metalloprotease [Congregibacter sp. IMCC43200]
MKIQLSVCYRLILWSVLAVGFTSVGGCGSMQNKPPELAKADIERTAREIRSYPLPIKKRVLSEPHAEGSLYRVNQKIRDAATSVCRHVDENSVCWWDVDYDSERELNAYATDENRIVVFHDVMAYSASDSEIAMVLAHEMGHHIADHISESQGRAMVGALLGAVAMAAVQANAGPCYSYACQQNSQNAISNMAEAGALIGDRAYSVRQEKEADLISAYILQLAGYDLFASRQMLLKMGAASGREKTGFLATHPAGPERLASYDKVISRVLNDLDGMPGGESKPDVAVETDVIVAVHNSSGSTQQVTPLGVLQAEADAVAEAMMCISSIRLDKVSDESEHYTADCGDGESLDIECFDGGSCYIRD